MTDTTHYVAHIKVERVDRTVTQSYSKPAESKTERTVSEVGQVTVRAATLDVLRTRVVQAADLVCVEEDKP